MTKKMVNWQTDKFTLSADGTKNNVYRQIRAEAQGLFQNGWELFSQEVASYEPATGDIVVLVAFVKYEDVADAPAGVSVENKAIKAEDKKETTKRGRPAKK